MSTPAKDESDAANAFKPVAARVASDAPFDSQIFKAVMRKVAGTVTVISTSSDEGLHGMTATAMCSVCAEPPTVLIVVNRTARTYPHIDRKKAFAINILAEDQLDIAELFASKTPDQFASVDFRRMDDDCPVIAQSVAYLHCVVEQQFDVGSHTIFVGQVMNGGVTSQQPLIYHDAKYCQVSGSLR